MSEQPLTKQDNDIKMINKGKILHDILIINWLYLYKKLILDVLNIMFYL